jgi:hypothetical protein
MGEKISCQLGQSELLGVHGLENMHFRILISCQCLAVDSDQ